jgi:hypothetical protein
MKSRAFCLALLSATAIVAGTPAQAAGTLTRTFVSAAGSDSNPCTITAPCASFAAAYNAVAADGIIAALDPGKYGPLAITMPVTVNGNGWAAITATAQGDGITIDAGTGNVILTGLEVDGADAAINGIVFNTGTSLTVSNCIVKDSTNNGILIEPTSGTINFTIINTIAINNSGGGITYAPQSGSATASGAIDHVVAANNSYGIEINTAMASGSAAVSISNSVASNNSADGIRVVGGTVTIDNNEISNNTIGVYIPTGTALLSRSVITKNSSYGIENFSTTDTFQNNQIYANGNSNVVQGIPLTAVSPQ